ncbi:MAG: apolipoprotein N-acyltransferase, partial [Spirochaetes bacterium]|nr:apolipoprotein N-acyltransferase [Spirochaetota bacterium]
MKRISHSDAAAILAPGCAYGLLATLSIEPFNLPLVPWLMPWPLFYCAVRFRNSIPRLILAGFSCAFFFCAIAFYWLVHLLTGFAGLGTAASLLVFVPFSLFIALQIPVFLVLFGLSHRDPCRRYLRPRWIAAGALALMADYAMPKLFPYSWGNFAAGNILLVQVTDLVGVYGLTPVLFAVSYFLYRLTRIALRAMRWRGSVNRLLRPHALKRLWPVPLLLVLCLSYGAVRLRQITALQESLPTVRVAIINPNAPPEDSRRVNAAVLQDLMFRTVPDLTAAAARASGGRMDLVALPESAIPFMCAEETTASRRLGKYSPEAELMAQLIAYNWNVDIFLNETSYNFVSGGRGGMELRVYNSSALYSRDGKRQATYKKRRLLAFGEYLPFEGLLRRLGLWEFVRKITGTSRFAPGPESNLIPYGTGNGAIPFRAHRIISHEDLRGLSPRDFEKGFPADRAFAADGCFIPLICFESLLPDHVRSFFTAPGNANPDFIVNITQDGWYGRTVETYQHFELARVRAVETRRALVRSVNNGAAGFVDLAGRHVRPLAGPVMTAQETAGFQVWDVPINRGTPSVYV